MKKSTFISAALAAAMIGGASVPVGAQTLTQTLKSALQTSPTIALNRSALRATEESVVQARAGRLPEIGLTGRATVSGSELGDWESNDSYTAGLSAQQLLYDGGRSGNQVQSAQASVDAARYQFLSVVQTVLLNAVTAFVDVRRDAQFVGLAENNVRVISQQVAAARDRFEVGEVTRTDVSQAEARLASARSNLASNRGQLERSRQAYVATVGISPDKLGAPPKLPQLPKTLAEAESIAMRTHPELAAARATIRAAEFDVAAAQAGRMPQVTLNADVGYAKNTSVPGVDNTTASVSLNGTVPIYQGGSISSNIRQAQAQLNRRKGELQDRARTVKQNVANAWSALSVARASISASREEIRSARLAFEGVQEEAKLGARTTLDVLDAEQTALNAESNLVSAQREEYVAAYNLIYAMGMLSPEFLNLGVAVLDGPANAEPISRQGAAVERLRGRWGN